jgi:glycosyltransferase involved in cell wall biosynthesis
VGRLSAEKNVRMLAAVERTLIASGLTAYRFVIIGEGSERPWLEQHMTRAELPGVLRGSALARAYADMDLFVFPSETDTVGNVVLEAMASGVPVIAMAQGGPKFIVEPNVSGLLVNDERELAAASLTLIRDRARRERMRMAARARAATLSWDRIFDSVYSVYAQVSRS